MTVDGVIRWGTLRKGDVIVCGDWHGKVRSVVADPLGKQEKEAGPGAPVRFSAALTCEGGGPLEGQFVVVEDAATARSVASLRGRAIQARRSAAEARSVADRVAVAVDDDAEETQVLRPPVVLKVATDAEAKACEAALQALPPTPSSPQLLRASRGRHRARRSRRRSAGRWP